MIPNQNMSKGCNLSRLNNLNLINSNTSFVNNIKLVEFDMKRLKKI